MARVPARPEAANIENRTPAEVGAAKRLTRSAIDS